MPLKSARQDVPAYVLGLSGTGLATLRALHKAGIEVSAFTAERGEPGRFSRLAKTFHAPAPETEPAALLEALLQAAPVHCRPVLIPTGDGHLQFMSRHRAALQTAFRFTLPAEAVVDAMVDKRLQAALAERHGVPLPRTIWAEDHHALLRKADEIAFPAFLKPVHSHLWRPVFHNKGLRLESPRDLAAALERIAPHGLAVVIQRIVPGPAGNHYEVCVYIDRQERPLAVFTTRKIRQWPVDFGIGTLLESRRHPELERRALGFLKAIGFKGTAAIEFKQDAQSGEFLMIETNGRLWSDHSLAVHCGLNYPLLGYLDLLGRPAEAITDYPEGVRWLDGGSDFWAALTLARRRQLGPVAWLKSFSGTRSFAYFDAADPLPFLWEMAQVPKRLLAYGLRRVQGPVRQDPPYRRAPGTEEVAVTPPSPPPGGVS